MQVKNKQFFSSKSYYQTQQSLDENVKQRKINLSFFHKTCFNSIDCTRDPEKYNQFLLKNIQIDTRQIQSLNLTGCNIKQLGFLFMKCQAPIFCPTTSFHNQDAAFRISSSYLSLHQLILDNNYIADVPFQLNQIKSLRTLKINNNFIKLLPIFDSLLILQSENNTIQIIVISIKNCKLKQIKFDWLDYIHSQYTYENQALNNFYLCNYSSQNQITTHFLEIIKNISQNEDEQKIGHSQGLFITFSQFFNAQLSTIDNQYEKNQLIIHLLRKAILEEFDEFIKYCLTKIKHINFSELRYKNILLLEYALESHYKLALQLFLQTQKNYNINDFLFLDTIILACKYSHYEYFKLLIGRTKNTQTISENGNHLISQVMLNFSFQLKSNIIIQSLISIGTIKQIIIEIPKNLDKERSLCFGNALVYILSSKDLAKMVSLEIQSKFNYPSKSLIEFALGFKNIYLLQLILFKLNLNILNKRNSVKNLFRTSKCLPLNKKIYCCRQNKLIEDNRNQKYIKENSYNRFENLLIKDRQILKKQQIYSSLFRIQQSISFDHFQRQLLNSPEKPSHLQSQNHFKKINFEVPTFPTKTNFSKRCLIKLSHNNFKENKAKSSTIESLLMNSKIQNKRYQYLKQIQNIQDQCIEQREHCQKVKDQYELFQQICYLDFIKISKAKKKDSEQSQTNISLFCQKINVLQEDRKIELFSKTFTFSNQNVELGKKCHRQKNKGLKNSKCFQY